MCWAFDPAASSDRMRLWSHANCVTPGDPYREVGGAYADGHWYVYNATGPGFRACAEGKEKNLQEAMQRLIKVASALDWDV